MKKDRLVAEFWATNDGKVVVDTYNMIKLVNLGSLNTLALKELLSKYKQHTYLYEEYYEAECITLVVSSTLLFEELKQNYEITFLTR